eukprot:1160915-Pelagomonas_calceolata.AAC.21
MHVHLAQSTYLHGVDVLHHALFSSKAEDLVVWHRLDAVAHVKDEAVIEHGGQVTPTHDEQVVVCAAVGDHWINESRVVEAWAGHRALLRDLLPAIVAFPIVKHPHVIVHLARAPVAPKDEDALLKVYFGGSEVCAGLRFGPLYLDLLPLLLFRVQEPHIIVAFILVQATKHQHVGLVHLRPCASKPWRGKA